LLTFSLQSGTLLSNHTTLINLPTQPQFFGASYEMEFSEEATMKPSTPLGAFG
jgi:hypothetical protein